jgi:hypothetical protein
MSALKPNYRRARELARDMEALRNQIDEAVNDPAYDANDIDELKAELRDLEREMFLTGVSSEYDL